MSRKLQSLCLLLTAVMLMSALCSGCAGRKEDEKTVVTVERESDSRESPAPTGTVFSSAPSEFSTAGDWYGWWKMNNTSGDWKKMYGYWWDCCAEISDNGSMLLWDEDLSREDYLAMLMLSEENGGLTVTGGTFMDRTVEPGSLKLTWENDRNGRLLTVSGHYDAVGSGGFDFEIYLRPWGEIWQSDEDSLPYYYEDWYLPLIRSGSPMPDSFD